jgi:hypothetical protein
VQTKGDSPSRQPGRKSVVLAWAVLLAGVTAVVTLGWIVLRVAQTFSSRVNPALPVGVITAIACAILIAWAIDRNGARRAIRLRSRAEVYEAALALVLQAAERQTAAKEWRRIRAQLLLWASPAVFDEFTEMEAMEFDPTGRALSSSTRVAALIRAMRADLEMPDLNLGENSDGELGDDPGDEK